MQRLLDVGLSISHLITKLHGHGNVYNLQLFQMINCGLLISPVVRYIFSSVELYLSWPVAARVLFQLLLDFYRILAPESRRKRQ